MLSRALEMLTHVMEEASRATASMLSARAQQDEGGEDSGEAFL